MLICIMNDKSMSFEIIWHIANFHRDSYGELVPFSTGHPSLT